jgi:hypothetical protein
LQVYMHPEDGGDKFLWNVQEITTTVDIFTVVKTDIQKLFLVLFT